MSPTLHTFDVLAAPPAPRALGMEGGLTLEPGLAGVSTTTRILLGGAVALSLAALLSGGGAPPPPPAPAVTPLSNFSVRHPCAQCGGY